ncbi:mitogen-activated protein kinase kinase kinase 3-like [Physella acuta]|uniref:mitogen-activated protein kinase kinase kinase 3-like n=1 Tax=Physella acuta TaxID=109671 RepID=UPI0027DC4F2E|nr:mitogen-activated protein kinase kinase kinase 3-like [Physella acuta]
MSDVLHEGPFMGDGVETFSNWIQGKPLGRTMSSVVYLVINKNNTEEKKYAAKQYFICDDIPGDNVNSVLNEMKALKQLDHENIVKFYGYSKTSHTISLFIEYMPEGSLATYIKTQPGGVLTEIKTLEFSIQITEAVIYLQGKRIIHRDIKGKNSYTSFNISSQYKKQQITL